jgi:hypothetical protein
MKNSCADPKFVKGTLLVAMAICVCGFMIFALVGFYNALHAECFPGVSASIDYSAKALVIVAGLYVGLLLIGVRGFRGISDAFVEDRGTNIFTGMFD